MYSWFRSDDLRLIAKAFHPTKQNHREPSLAQRLARFERAKCTKFGPVGAMGPTLAGLSQTSPVPARRLGGGHNALLPGPGSLQETWAGPETATVETHQRLIC